MSVVWFVRHGQASFGKADYDALSELGVEQARLLGSSLRSRGVEPARLVVGSLRRHRQTAEALRAAAGWSTACTIDADLDEFDHLELIARHVPRYRNRTLLWAEMAASLEPAARFRSLLADATERWTAGAHDAEYDEPFHRFEARCQAALARAVAGHPGGAATVVVTSGGVIATISRSLLGLDNMAWRRVLLTLVNTGATKSVHGSAGSRLVTLNEHGHLEGADLRRITYL